jgi:hypothetical protein
MRPAILTGALALLLGITSASAAPLMTTLYNFAPAETPGYGQILIDNNGAVYGTIAAGGSTCVSPGCGAIYQLTPQGGSWTKTNLYEFMGNMDGIRPLGLPVMDASGTLYGTTEGGGIDNLGTIYDLTAPPGGGIPWTETQLHLFNGPPNGFFPESGLVLDGAGGFFGTAFYSTFNGGGTVYHLTPPAPGASTWSYQVIATLGQPIYASPLLAPDGSLYVVTTNVTTIDLPAIYKLTPPLPGATAWTVTNIKQLNSGPIRSSLIMDRNGALYGTRLNNVFMVAPPKGKSTKWTSKILASFSGATRATLGQNLSGVIMDASGALYGLTENGGTGSGPNCDRYGCGTLFKLSPPAAGQTKWSVSILVGSSGGRNLSAGPDGTLYGIGPVKVTGSAAGSVFQVTGTGFQPPAP